MSVPAFSIIVACASFTLSATTLWLTLLRRGSLKMTRPTMLFFGPDGKDGVPKVFLRTLLYSTGKRGLLIENMFVSIRRNESVQTFNVWVYGNDHLARGSGLYVGLEGTALNHHFLHPRDGTNYAFLEGQYTVEVFASLVGARRVIKLASISLPLSESFSQAIVAKKAGVFFDWGPDSQSYHAHLNDYPQSVAAGDPLAQLIEAMNPRPTAVVNQASAAGAK